MINFDTIPDSPPHSDDASETSENRERLARVRRELLEYRPDVLDDDLRAAVTAWLLRAADVPAADTEDYITTTLMRLRQGNAMYEQSHHAEGREAFPEKCEGCPHYGVRCPVITDNDQIQRRERIMRAADSAKALRREMKEYAIDNECHVLLNVIADLSASVEPLLESGRKLLMAVEEEMLFDDSDEEVQRILASIDALDDLTDPDADLADLDATADLVDDAGADGVGPDGSDGALVDALADADLDALRPDGGWEGAGGRTDDRTDDGFEYVTPADLAGDDDRGAE